MSKNPLSCRFCEPPEPDRILFRSEHFYVMLSLGPLVEGYLLLLSKQHFPSCAEIPLGLLHEFYALKEEIRRVLMKVYGASVFYEHGRTGSCLPSSPMERHCYHAHLHCVPTEEDIYEDIADYFSPIPTSQWVEAASTVDLVKEGYFYYENQRGQAWYFPVQKTVRSQFLRWLLASRLGDPRKANWKLFPDREHVASARMRLQPFFPDESELLKQLAVEG